VAAPKPEPKAAPKREQQQIIEVEEEPAMVEAAEPDEPLKLPIRALPVKIKSADALKIAGNIAKAKNPADFKIVGEVLSVEPIAIMIRKDDPAFKKAVDDSIVAMMKSGETAKLYDKWFMQPIAPSNTKVGLPVSEATKTAWANPNDKPVEEYMAKK
jgi:hypothetical protein